MRDYGIQPSLATTKIRVIGKPALDVGELIVDIRLEAHEQQSDVFLWTGLRRGIIFRFRITITVRNSSASDPVGALFGIRTSRLDGVTTRVHFPYVSVEWAFEPLGILLIESEVVGDWFGESVKWPEHDRRAILETPDGKSAR